MSDILVLKNGQRLKGQIVENYPGKTLKIITDDNAVSVYDYTDIKAIRKEKLNSSHPLFEQSYLIDKVVMKDSDVTIVGVIVEQMLGTSVCIELEKGLQETIALNKILSYSKEKNKNYYPVVEIVLQAGEVQYDGKLIKYKTITPVNNLFIINKEHVSDVVKVGEEVVLYANFISPNAGLSITKSERIEENASFLGMGNKKNFYDVFSYEDFVKSLVPYTRTEPSEFKTVKITFKADSKGYYIIKTTDQEGFIVLKAEM